MPLLTFILLAAVGLDLTPAHFARIRRQKLVVAAGVFAPLVLLPPLAIGLVWLFQPAPYIADSLLLVAVCPVGGISNTYTYLARASTALSVTLASLSSLLAGVTIPLVGRTLEISLGRSLQLTAPLPLLVAELVLMLTLPVAVGMWIRRRWTDLASHYQASVQRVAFIGVGIVLLLIILDNPRAFIDGVWTDVPFAAMFVAASAAIGWGTAATITGDRRDRFAFAAEFGSRNLGVAMALAVTFLGRVDFARFAYTYFLIEMPLMLAAIALFRRSQRSPAVQEV